MPLKKVVTLPTVVSTSAGLTFATSCFVAAVQVASYLAGDAAWIAIITSGFLCLLAGLCFSELNALLPSAAGLRLYFSRAFNDRFSLVVSLVYMMVVTTVIGTESFILSKVIAQAVPGIPPLLWIVVMLLIVTALNLRGIRIAGIFQNIITYGLILSLLVIALLTFSRIEIDTAALFNIGNAGGFVNAVAVGVFLFIGFEWVTPLAEEVMDHRLISRGMLIAIGLLSITYGLFTNAMTSLVDATTLGESPIPHVLFARSLMGSAGVAWITILSLGASITTFNAGLLSVSRFLYATAREGALPGSFSRLNRYFSPWFAIVALFVFALVVSILVYATNSYLLLVNVGAATEAIIYSLAGVAVIRLRKKNPTTKMSSFTIPGGITVPLATTVVFALLTAAVFSVNPWTILYIAVVYAITYAYVSLLVPRIKVKQQAKKTRRRPSRVEQTGK